MTRAGRCVSSSCSIRRARVRSSRIGSRGRGAGASGLTYEFAAAVLGSAEDAGATAGGGAREGQGTDAPGGRAA